VLVRDDALVIGQPAHAWVSGQLARAWGNAGFPAPDPREPVCLAAEQHDVGWVDADLEPVAGPSGRPRSFTEQPRTAHVAIWRAAARRLLAQSRYAALLVSLHGTTLYDTVDVDAAAPEVAAEIRAYLAGERALQASLSDGLDPAEVDRNRRLLRTWDRLSLALCLPALGIVLDDVPGAAGAATIRLAPGAAGSGEPGGRDDRAVPPATPADRVVVDPWPFAAPRVVAGCEARRLGDGADAAALARAPWVPLRWELSPA
jgi:uncharacterized protein DUF3891